MANNGDLLIHHLIDSIQRSIDLADKTSRKKYNFALARMEVKMTLDFEIKVDESKSRNQAGGHHHLFSLFSRKNDPQTSNTEGDVQDRHGSLTLQMLFKPGGKAFLQDTSDSDSSSSSSSSSSPSSSSSGDDQFTEDFGSDDSSSDDDFGDDSDSSSDDAGSDDDY